MATYYSIGIGLTLITFVLFLYVMVDCLRRSEKDFPAFIYGGKEVSQRTIKKTWLWIVILTFILGVAVRPTIYGYSATMDKTLLSGTITSKYEFWTLYSTYQAEQVGDKVILIENTWRVPLFFFFGLYLYWRGVKRWPRKHTGSHSGQEN
jgi:hypothetical protein